MILGFSHQYEMVYIRVSQIKKKSGFDLHNLSRVVSINKTTPKQISGFLGLIQAGAARFHFKKEIPKIYKGK